MAQETIIIAQLDLFIMIYSFRYQINQKNIETKDQFLYDDSNFDHSNRKCMK